MAAGGRELAEFVFELCAPLGVPTLSATARLDAAPDQSRQLPLDTQMRRLAQARAYAATLGELGLLRNSACYVELGAGSALVSREVRKALPVDQSGHFLLVDKRTKEPPDGMCPVSCDLDHISSWQSLQQLANLDVSEATPVVVLANHLCGGALDRSLLTFAAEPLVEGVLAATCCHYLVTWESYCNRKFMTHRGIGEDDFARILEWSALAPRRGKVPEARSAVLRTADELQLAPSECEQLGIACRLLIDTGRKEFLEAHGFRADLRHHVPFEMTGDNVMLAAHRVSSCGAVDNG